MLRKKQEKTERREKLGNFEVNKQSQKRREKK